MMALRERRERGRQGGKEGGKYLEVGEGLLVQGFFNFSRLVLWLQALCM